MAPEHKDVEIESFRERCFFRAHSFQIGLATCNFFIGMVPCFQNQTLIHETDRCSHI